MFFIMIIFIFLYGPIIMYDRVEHQSLLRYTFCLWRRRPYKIYRYRKLSDNDRCLFFPYINLIMSYNTRDLYACVSMCKCTEE